MSKATAKALVPVWRRSEPKDLTLPTVLEFQWPSTVIVNAPTPRSARGIIWVITSMVVALIAAAGLISIDRVVTASGIVVSQARTIQVQPLETAIVRSIDVREGQQVRAGQVLAQLDPTFASADADALGVQVTNFEAEVARLRAEAQGKPFEYSGNDPQWLLQVAIYGHRKAMYDSRVENYRQKLAELTAKISTSQSDAAGFRERLNVAENIEGMRKSLEEKQIGSRLSTLLAVDNRAEMGRALAAARQTEERGKRDFDAMTAERNAFIQGWQAEISQKLSESAGKLNDAQELLNKAKLRRKLVVLRSESDAIVQSVAKVSVGSVMQSGQPFLTLVPADTPLEVESNIFGRENGFVHVGDQVAIKFDTFPYSQYGMARGTVRVVSPDSFNAQSDARNPTTALPVSQWSTEPFYRARIAVDRLELRNLPDGFHLTPGMPVTTDIKVGQGTVLWYFLNKIMPVAQEGMREP